MKILDRIILSIFILIILGLSFCTIVIPFDIAGIFSINSIINFIISMNRNYYYSIAGAILFFLGIRMIFIGVFKNSKKSEGAYLIAKNEYGDIIIYSNTIVGLIENIVSGFSGINNIKTEVNLIDGQVSIDLIGEVLPEINIPQVTEDLQSIVKENIEKTTGAIVSEVRIKINNVSTPSRNIK